MKLGLGLYRHMLKREFYRFARQCGATHIVAHLVDYMNQCTPANAGARGDDQPIEAPGSRAGGYGYAGNPDKLWTTEELVALRKEIESEGLELAAIENFDPAHWHDVLLDGPKKQEQLENVKTTIRRVGEAGIPCLGYYFSIAGVTARLTGPFARGGAQSVGLDGGYDVPVPNGMVWNMIYDPHAAPGNVAPCTEEALWSRVADFLNAALPVAEKAGVQLAAHPDDPPVPTLRGTPRLVYQPDHYQRLLDLRKSPSNMLEFCLGTIAEMPGSDPLEVIDRYSRQEKLAYVHFRNVRGKAPKYREVFLDEGDVDMLKVMRILKKNNFQGVMIPDHTPLMTCEAPWHAGMAYAMGFMQAALKSCQ